MAHKKFLKDYTPSAYEIKRIDLIFYLDPDATVVEAVYQVQQQRDEPLILQGKALTLLSIKRDGKLMDDDEYSATESELVIKHMPNACELRIKTRIAPAKNTSLEGLYQSNGLFCTQCEAEGFRAIMYALDRPDCLSAYTTKIIADKAQYPILLSNGNKIEAGELPYGQHYAIWEDPHLKPSYLFALVAGDLSCIQDEFTTQSGRRVALEIFVEHHNQHKCAHAMSSLKNAMRWDETRFGLEYDLDVYMIVAVDDFNMGAMENKGLNVFNSKYVLATDDTATDTDFAGIESVIGHEYFHNWTGNRITCRDWFQLSLKEGLTVFRDQEFSADLNVRDIQRINDVNTLKTHQFAEDAGPTAHAVRPESYVEINNFYTLTIYEKGAEVIRILHTLLGEDGFQKGMQLYVQRHDGTAATCDDFVQAMADANQHDLTAFKRWYSHAGTPVLAMRDEYDSDKQQYRMQFEQSGYHWPEGNDLGALTLPIKMALLNPDGEVIDDSERLIVMDESHLSMTFDHVPQRPTPALLKGFSAPVKLDYPFTPDQCLLLAKHERDGFVRWDACQQLWLNVLLRMIERLQASETEANRSDISFDDLVAPVVELVEHLLLNANEHLALTAAMLTLPSESYISDQMQQVDPGAVNWARKTLKKAVAKQCLKLFDEVYQENNAQTDYQFKPQDVAERSIKNVCLSYFAALDNAFGFERSLAQYRDSHNMTDRLAALTCLSQYNGEARDDIMQQFYQDWQADTQVVNQWLGIMAGANQIHALKGVQILMQHEAFSLSNPNKVFAVVGGFCRRNPVAFHDASGKAYEWLGNVVMTLDESNPQIAARMVTPFAQWRRFDEDRQQKMQQVMQNIVTKKGISNNVKERMEQMLAATD